jgi:cytochrome b involved in lipid metabolism
MTISIDESPAHHDNNNRTTISNTSTDRQSSGARLSSLRSMLGIPASGVPINGKASSSLGVPPSTTARTAPPGVGGAGGARLGVQTLKHDQEGGRATLTSEIAPKRKKVVLEPGCSALDWAVKKGKMAEERSRRPDGMRIQRITPSQLKTHNTREDAWSAFNGKVYDITPYLRFHPGGVQELMRVAGRDGTRLFMLTHSWVNIDAMIDACCVGILVSE